MRPNTHNEIGEYPPSTLELVADSVAEKRNIDYEDRTTPLFSGHVLLHKTKLGTINYNDGNSACLIYARYVSIYPDYHYSIPLGLDAPMPVRTYSADYIPKERLCEYPEAQRKELTRRCFLEQYSESLALFLPPLY